MDLQLSGTVAFVAGASKGLGYATAHAIAREKGHVVICSRSKENIEAASARIRKDVEGAKVEGLACDVTDAGEVADAVRQTVDRFGKLNILITNAGGPPSGAATDFSRQDWQKAFELNLLSTITLCEEATPHLRKAAAEDGFARILMITSAAAKEPIPRLALSNTARAGVLGYMKSLAHALGPDGITVNSILPGYTKTERLEQLADASRKEDERSREQVFDAWAENNMLKRIGDPAEFGAAAAFLVSKPAAYITGVALAVDGGRTRHLL